MTGINARQLAWLVPISLIACRPQTPPVTPIAGPTISVSPATRTSNSPYKLPDDTQLFTAGDVFALEWAADPQISPDGQWIVYVRGSMNEMTDRKRSQLWLASRDGKVHRPLTTLDDGDASSPRWSPTADRILYVSRGRRGTQLHMRWMDSGQVARITDLRQSPRNIEWSPAGDRIAFVMHVAAEQEPLVQLPGPPKDAEWAEPPRLVDRVTYRQDGGGAVQLGNDHLFVIAADGGTPRQLTQGDFHHRDPAWAPDGQSIIVVANRRPDWEYTSTQLDLYAVDTADGTMRRLTDRDGPDSSPAISPDGKFVAYVGYDDLRKGHHVQQLYVKPLAGGEPRVLTADLDRSVQSPVWRADGKGVYVAYDDQGNGKIAYVDLSGERQLVARDRGGLSLGRPYGSGTFSVADDGSVVFPMTRPEYPAELAVVADGSVEARRLTHLNDDLLAHKRLATVEELWVNSSHDGRPVHAWLMRPPGFDPTKKYPMILEIHGGPFANYGDRWAAELQLMASAGYVVLYVNPRGSTSYGNEFANLIYHAYPGHDYDDLMSAVDAAVGLGHIDPQRLYVTGGSGGGVLTSWIVGKTDRFRAAVVAKPVINWYSFVLTADHAPFFVDYWFPGPPWEQPEHYMQRSPLSLVGNVSTPTMLLTGERDYRTPMSETEQYYQALKLRRIESAMVRIPGASHSIAARPSQLVAKVAYILGWFHRHANEQ